MEADRAGVVGSVVCEVLVAAAESENRGSKVLLDLSEVVEKTAVGNYEAAKSTLHHSTAHHRDASAVAAVLLDLAVVDLVDTPSDRAAVSHLPEVDRESAPDNPASAVSAAGVELRDSHQDYQDSSASTAVQTPVAVQAAATSPTAHIPRVHMRCHRTDSRHVPSAAVDGRTVAEAGVARDSLL